ncbi:MAG TPA: response regulator [Bacteroidaceae bacterium]|nr:response regulator [Bacteroidaceae bacterium]
MEAEANSLFNSIHTEDFDWQDRVFLITEDEEVNFFYLKTLLKRTSARILRATNGQEAVDLITGNNHKVDLILMDINMPVMNGYEAARIIKSTHPHIPIVAQTAYSHTEDREKCLKAGFNDYIAKPIRKAALFNLVGKLLVNHL